MIKHILLFIIFLHFSILVDANEFICKQINSANGLPQNYVRSIIQDSRGFMWFTTFDGIVRYDGYSFKVYRRYDNGLDTGLMLYVTEDSGGDIWIGTETGIYLYTIDTDHFTRVSSYLPKDSGIQKTILKIKPIGKDQIWVYTGKGGIYQIKIIDKQNNKYQLQKYLDAYTYFPNICIPFNGQNLTVAEGKVYTFDESHNTFKPFQKDILQDIDQIFVYKEQLYLLKKGLAYLYNEKTSTLFQLTSQHARELFISSDNQLWISSFDGLYRTSLKGASPDRQMETIFKGNPWTTSFTEDYLGDIWIGTYRNGAFCFRKNHSPFQQYLNDKNIECMEADGQGNYWIGSLNGEVCFFDPSQNKIIGKSIFPNDMIHTIYKQKNVNKIWVGTLNGLYETWMNGTQIYSQKVENVNLPAIRSMATDSCFLWIATYNNGIALYNRATKQCIATYNIRSKKVPLPSNCVRTLLKDKEGNIWIGTTEGLIVMEHKSRFTNRPSLLRFNFSTHQNGILFQDNIVSVIESRNGDIWVGTLDNGLYHLQRNPATDSWNYQWINNKKGLSNNSIKSILEDKSGFVWVTTNKGLNQIDPQNQSIKTYLLNDGLANNEFSERACLSKQDGTLMFGGINGITSFNPAFFVEDTILPRVAFVNLTIHNKSIRIGEEVNGEIPLKRSILNTHHLVLSNQNNNFSFDFVGLHFTAADKIVYKYKLEGFDKEWIANDAGNRSAKYTNIPPGNYTFLVKASCNGTTWSEPEKIEIEILQSLFLRWYFLILYVVILIFIVSMIIRNFRIREKRKNELILAQKEKKQIRELSEMKMNFFMNLSHEFRTPLTLIISPLQKLLSTPDIPKDELSRHLMNIQHNSSILLRLVNQILKLSKQDKGKLDIDLVQGDIVSFCQNCFVQFTQVANDKQLQFTFNSSSSTIPLLFDTYKMEEIIYNLLSNAIKYTPEKGSVVLKVTHKEEGVEISVIDSGLGMTEDVKKHIFKRFYSESGIGIGLSLTKSLVELHNGTIEFESENRQGTTFRVFMPFQYKANLPKYMNTEVEVQQIENNLSPSSLPDSMPYAEHKDESEEEDKQSILVVDDHKGIVQMLEELLSPYYKVLTAYNGKAAFDLCRAQMPSLVISDIIMPGMNGIELCSAIKSAEETSHIPVILLTAKTSKEAQQEGLAVYADAYCSKPFDNDLLISTVHSILTNREKIVQKFKSNLMSEENPAGIFEEKKNQDFIRNIIQIIENNISNEELSVLLICHTIGMSQLTLNKKIKQLTNQTTNAFIRSIRLKKASQMILSQQYSISEVTYAVGFSDLRYFRECFKKEFGVLPSDFKKPAN